MELLYDAIVFGWFGVWLGIALAEMKHGVGVSREAQFGLVLALVLIVARLTPVVLQ